MAKKVYWIALTSVLNGTRRYIQRNQLRLEANLTESQSNCVVAVLNAILTCLASLPKETPNV